MEMGDIIIIPIYIVKLGKEGTDIAPPVLEHLHRDMATSSHQVFFEKRLYTGFLLLRIR